MARLCRRAQPQVETEQADGRRRCSHVLRHPRIVSLPSLRGGSGEPHHPARPSAGTGRRFSAGCAASPRAHPACEARGAHFAAARGRADLQRACGRLVIDDGCGQSRDGAQLCIRRVWATSQWKIYTMAFAVMLGAGLLALVAAVVAVVAPIAAKQLGSSWQRGIVILLVWMWFSSLALMLGAEINAVLRPPPN